ncbi:MAG TPA: tRNA lysidine(34) synthetase TilS [bacterium]|nr:tRNA lysidine(34) synthetase TilS [bacterium]HPN31188.1 tRNA lysidine(34) synthetase TilS [bacterium]
MIAEVIKNNLLKYRIDFNKKALIGLSGGPDSVFLTEILLKLFPAENIFCCHINHQLRENAAADAEFAIKYCSKSGIRLFLKKIQTKQYAEKNKISIETAGRELRYAEFENLIKENDIDYLFTAHNADDNIETFFMRLIRGTGLTGLECIKEFSNRNQYIILRPILNVSKKTVLDYLKKNFIGFVSDESNFDEKYFRNYIRKNIVSKIKTDFGDNSFDNLNGLIENIKMNNNFIKKIVSEHFDEIIKINVSEKKIIINRDKFNLKDEFLKRELLRKSLEKLKKMKIGEYDSSGDSGLYGVESKHIIYLIDFIKNTQSGRRINLPENIIAENEFEKTILFFETKKKNKNDLTEEKIEVELNRLPVEINFMNEKFYISIEKNPVLETENKNITAIIPADGCDKFSDKKIVFRNARNSDKIKINGFKKGRKTLKKIFQEKKTPVSERKKVFCIEFNGEIIYCRDLYEKKPIKIEFNKPELVIKKI